MPDATAPRFRSTVRITHETILWLTRGTFRVIENAIPADAELEAVLIDHDRRDLVLEFSSSAPHEGGAPVIRALNGWDPLRAVDAERRTWLDARAEALLADGDAAELAGIEAALEALDNVRGRIQEELRG